MAIREGKMADTLAETIVESKATRLGFEANFTTVGQIDSLERAMQVLKDKPPADGNGRDRSGGIS